MGVDRPYNSSVEPSMSRKDLASYLVERNIIPELSARPKRITSPRATAVDSHQLDAASGS